MQFSLTFHASKPNQVAKWLHRLREGITVGSVGRQNTMAEIETVCPASTEVSDLCSHGIQR